MTVEAVVFDIGRVLLHWDPEGAFDRAIGSARRRALFAEVDLWEMNDRIDMGENFHQAVRDKAAAHPEWHDEIMLWERLWPEMAAPEMSLTTDLLRALKARGIPVYALTNFGVQTMQIAERRYPFLLEFDRRFVSGELRMMKPDPAIYAHLEAETGHAPQALLFTDDRADNISTARARGWQVHRFEHSRALARRLVAEGLLGEEDIRP